METFEANSKLEELFLRKGFVDTTPEDERIKGKRRFRLSKQTRREIYFNYENIQFIIRSTVFVDRQRLTKEELSLILLCFKLSASDLNALGGQNRGFELGEIKKQMSFLREQLNALKTSSSKKMKREKLERILSAYDQISLE